jgi:excisionase family DNA binding protein
MPDVIQANRPYISTTEAAEISKLTKNYIALLLRRGVLEGFHLGRDWFLYRDSLDKFLSAPRKPGPPGPRKDKNQSN